MTSDETVVVWRRSQWLALALVLVAATAIRLILLPTTGLRADMDVVAKWIHNIAVNGLGQAYGEDVSYGPAMAWLWGLFAAINPAFQTVSDASDPAIRIFLKLPIVLADFGLAAAAGIFLRSRPWLSIAAMAVILLHPAVWLLSSWWGQADSVYALPAVVSVLLVVRGRFDLATIVFAVALMIKPQAAPLAIPIVAVIAARRGPIGLLRAAAIGAVVVVVLWLPFIAADGPSNYLRNIAGYQDQRFGFLSLRTWNFWWLIQSLGPPNTFALDSTSLVGPITFRVLGYLLVGGIAVVTARRVATDGRPVTILLGATVIAICAFTFLTTMHERYGFLVVPLLALGVADVRLRWLGVVFGAVFTVNLLASLYDLQVLALGIPLWGPLGTLASLAITAVAVALLVDLLRTETPEAEARPSIYGTETAHVVP